MLSPLVTMFIIARFILGFANIFCTVAAASLIGGKKMWFYLSLAQKLCEELSHPKERAFMSSFFIASYDLGNLNSRSFTSELQANYLQVLLLLLRWPYGHSPCPVIGGGEYPHSFK